MIRFKKIAPVVFSLTMISSFSYAAPNSSPITLDRLEAAVNNSLILKSDVKKFRDTLPLRSQLDPLFAGTPVAAKGAKAAESEITQFLIDEKMIQQQFPIPDADVEQEINQIQANNRITRDTLKAALKDQGFSFDEYSELIRVSLAKRNLIDRDIRTKVSISEDDIKNYFYNNLSQKNSTVMAYKVKVISVSPQNYKNPSAAKEVLERAIKSVKAGEPFEEVAKRVSDDPSAQTGGDLGTLTEDQMSPMIKDAVKKLQIGQVSDVIGDPKSRFLVLKLVDLSSTENDRLAKMAPEIRNQLAAAEYQRQIQLWIERQRQSAFIHRSGEPIIAGLPRQ